MSHLRYLPSSKGGTFALSKEVVRYKGTQRNTFVSNVTNDHLAPASAKVIALDDAAGSSFVGEIHIKSDIPRHPINIFDDLCLKVL